MNWCHGGFSTTAGFRDMEVGSYHDVFALFRLLLETGRNWGKIVMGFFVGEGCVCNSVPERGVYDA